MKKFTLVGFVATALENALESELDKLNGKVHLKDASEAIEAKLEGVILELAETRRRLETVEEQLLNLPQSKPLTSSVNLPSCFNAEHLKEVANTIIHFYPLQKRKEVERVFKRFFAALPELAK